MIPFFGRTRLAALLMDNPTKMQTKKIFLNIIDRSEKSMEFCVQFAGQYDYTVNQWTNVIARSEKSMAKCMLN